MLVRDGADHDGIADGLQRPLSTVGTRVRRLLPVAERRCPSDRVLSAAREHLSDPAYDWRHVMLLSEPPRPPAPLPAPIIRGGISGLTDDDLVTTAYGLLFAFRESRIPVVREVAREIGHRGLLLDLIGRRADHLLHRPGETVPRTPRHTTSRRAGSGTPRCGSTTTTTPLPWGYAPNDDYEDRWSRPRH